MKLSILGLTLRSILWDIFKRFHGMRVTVNGRVYNGVMGVSIDGNQMTLTRGSWESETFPIAGKIDIQEEV